MDQCIHAEANPRNKSRAYPITSFKDRDDWIRLMLAADDITMTAKVIVTRIALHHNVDSGRCHPQLPVLASGTGLSDRHIRRMLADLEEAGWLIIHRSLGGRREGEIYNSHSFELASPVTRTYVSALNPDTDVRVKEPNPDKPGHLTRTNRVANPDTVVRQDKSESNSEDKSEERLSPLADADLDSARRNLNANFEEFYRQYPKDAAKNMAKQTYSRIIFKGLATPEVLLAGAMRYAAERNGQDPKYTKNAGNWLYGHCWADEPVARSSGFTRPMNTMDVAIQLAAQAHASEAGHG